MGTLCSTGWCRVSCRLHSHCREEDYLCLDGYCYPRCKEDKDCLHRMSVCKKEVGLCSVEFDDAGS